MLFILPPPPAPAPPSPWTTILYGAPNGSSVVSYRGLANKTGTFDAWVTISPTNGKPPRRPRNRNFQSRKDAGAPSTDDEDTKNRSLSECYFAGKGAALVLPQNERARPCRRAAPAGAAGAAGAGATVSGPDIQQHLQSMFYLLRPEETLKMAVKLESVHPGRTRYLVVVSCMGRRDAEESCLLGIDCNERTTVGLVLRVLADTAITLDGDGGFSVSVCGRQHIFKPVSVQAMWSALQTLHKVSSKAREQNYFLGGVTHEWVSYYEQRIESERSCLNEWHAMDCLESRRPPSPDSVRSKPGERDETERVIRTALKEIMMSVDLDEVTSKHIRGRLEEHLDMDLGEFKPFIDQEMLTILGQMDAATEIFDHVYLGSEWNASNLEELQKNGVLHILNVTREIDNFFPGMFNYLNVRVYDDERTDMLKHWDDTFKYITRAKKEGSKVLVHCKMGVSRSASVVIAYAMKAFNWDFKRAFEYVKEKRTCIKPNTSFISQLETYQGILDAMKNREKLQRSKSETNLKLPNHLVSKGSSEASVATSILRSENETTVRPLKSSSSSSASPRRLKNDGDSILSSPSNLNETTSDNLIRPSTPPDSVHLPVSVEWLTEPTSFGRPKSWSPDKASTEILLSTKSPQGSISLEQLVNANDDIESSSIQETSCDQTFDQTHENTNLTRDKPTHTPNVRMPCGNGQAYSVSQNKALFLTQEPETQVSPPSVKHRVSALEARKRLVLELPSTIKSETNIEEPEVCDRVTPSASELSGLEEEIREAPVQAQTKEHPQMLTAVLLKKEIWDPGERAVATLPRTKRDGDPFSAQLDKVFDREERRQSRTPPPVLETPAPPVPITQGLGIRETPSRQSSWSSYDSAVVLNFQGEQRGTPSRQSSWGSGDTRLASGTAPSRNSSWGSYDMRSGNGSVSGPMQCVIEGSSGIFSFDRDEITCYPGTVKRTKQRLEEGGTSSGIKRICPEPERTDTDSSTLTESTEGSATITTANITVSSKDSSNLSASAPAACSGGLAERLANSTTVSAPSAARSLPSVGTDCDKVVVSNPPPAGHVRNLKKEFEAKSARSREPGERTPSPPPPEDVSVKMLVGKYEIRGAATSQEQPTSSSVVAAVVAKAVSKKQQQQHHQLARLTSKPRPVYNTM